MAYDMTDLCTGRAAARARTWPCQGVCHDTIIVSWLRGATVVSRYSATRATIWRRMRHDTDTYACDTDEEPAIWRAIVLTATQVHDTAG